MQIYYFNLTSASTIVVPTSVELDQSGYIGISGKPLGDHYPLIARFSLVSNRGVTTGVGTAAAATAADDEWYSLQGIKQDAEAKGLVINRSGKKKVQK